MYREFKMAFDGFRLRIVYCALDIEIFFSHIHSLYCITHNKQQAFWVVL